MKSISVHRFGDKCALAILGQDGETVYMSESQARAVAANLTTCADSIARESFGKSAVNLESVNIGEGSCYGT